VEARVGAVATFDHTSRERSVIVLVVMVVGERVAVLDLKVRVVLMLVVCPLSTGRGARGRSGRGGVGRRMVCHGGLNVALLVAGLLSGDPI